jgi:predicted nucleotidyltransferase
MIYTNKFIENHKFDNNSLFIKDNLLLESLMGSHCYATNNEESDYDIVGLYMDRQQDLFPQSYGMILGFDNLGRFESKECKDKNSIVLENGKKCEGEWHSLTNFFNLAGLKGSPNLIEVLFVKRNFVTSSSNVGWMLRDNRKMFLSMKTFHAFRGYAVGQLHRVRNEVVSGKSDSIKRQASLDKYGYCVKQSYHLLRLLDNLEQILTVQDIDLQRNKEQSLNMRAGTWGTFQELETYFNKKMIALEELICKTSLSPQPQTGALHQLLANCIEEFYGSESKMSKQGTEYVSVKMMMDRLDNMETVLNKVEERTRPPEPFRPGPVTFE